MGNFHLRQLQKKRQHCRVQFIILKYIKRLLGNIQGNIQHVFVSQCIKTIVWIFPVCQCIKMIVWIFPVCQCIKTIVWIFPICQCIKTIVWLFPVCHCYVIYVTNISYVVSISTYMFHHYIKCACKIS